MILQIVDKNKTMTLTKQKTSIKKENRTTID